MQAHTIDWTAVHRRLAASATAISEGLDRTPQDVRRILAERARAAATPPAAPDRAERLEVLAFTLGGENYGVETRHVREVCQLRDLTALPCTPPFVAGVTNLRGRVLGVVDLRRLFDLPARGLTELNRIVVLRGGDHELGLLADAITGVRSVVASDLQAGMATLAGVRETFLKGIAGRALVVLDGERLLTDASLKVNEKVT